MAAITHDIEQLTANIISSIETNKQIYLKTSHQIHERPEIGNQEYFA